MSYHVNTLFGLSLCALSILSAAEEFVVGLQSGYPPFEFVDAKGEIVGFDVDLSRIISEKLGKKLVVKDMDFDCEILSMQQGKIDVIISGMNITASRKKIIHMVPYHGSGATSLSLVFWSEIPSNVKTLLDISTLPKPVVSVGIGTVSEEYATTFPEVQVRALEGALAPLMDVKYGKSSANLVEKEVGVYIHEQYPHTHVLDIPIEKNRILGFGIGIKKENAQLICQVESVVQDLVETGEMAALEHQWFGGSL